MMAKITHGAGPTNADDPNATEQTTDEQAVDEVTTGVAETGEPDAQDGDSSDGPEETDDSTDPAADARALYEAATVEELKTELRERDRGLSVTGNKPELVDRLLEDDAARAAEVEDAEAANEVRAEAGAAEGTGEVGDPS
ncbi:SAP domain-containing protein [Amycolatopsis thailandensis]|uniref:SAP domain-containing protein n=1 Tax=Amycolatopsis thailandensis TaxID=589330 RepID=UPI0037A3DFD1